MTTQPSATIGPRARPSIEQDRLVSRHRVLHMLNTHRSLIESYAGRTILVTGARGYIGSALVEALLQVRCRLFLLVRPGSNVELPEDAAAAVTVLYGNVGERETWRGALDGADYVFHLAAHEHKHGTEFNPSLDLNVNTLSVLHMLEECRERGLSPRIIFASATSVTGLTSTIPVDESVPDNPLTTFAINKIAAERYLQHYYREFHLQTVPLRLANVYGPAPDHEVARRVVLNKIVTKATRGEPLTIFENHNCIRDYAYIDDVISAFLLAGIREEVLTGQHYVIGSGVGWTIEDVVNLIADRAALKTGHRPNVELNVEEPLESAEWRNFVADSSSFKSATGWCHNTSLTKGIDRTIDFFIDELAKAKV